jgi:aminoglycoside phosphotransferase (APT) family kinase protein
VSAEEAVAGALSARMTEISGEPVTVTGLRRLSGGASRETWAFDAGDRPLILRRDPPSDPRPAEMAREAAALAAAARGGVPVPHLVDNGPDAAGAPYLIMERLAGETIPRRLLRDERFAAVRPRLAHELGTILARIHALSPADIPGLPDGDPLAELTEWYESFGEPRPAIELALRRLTRDPFGGAEHPDRTSGVVHGDFRNGNLLIGDTGVLGVLDWEMVHAGEVAEDLGWLCVKAWRFGAAAPVGGFGTRADLLAGYSAAGGMVPSPEVLRWWEIYGTLRWAVLCRHQAERYLSGAESSVELAVLGRRVCEQEYDLLLILGMAEPRLVADPLDDAPAAARAEPHDRPGATDLMAAVGGFLTENVAPAGDERLRFHALVANAALRIARREILLSERHREAHDERLRGLGVADDAELARRIRDGSLDDRFADVVAVVRATVADKLTVANPRHLSLPA